MDPTRRTVELAVENVEGGGRPFAGVIVRGSELVAESPNFDQLNS